MEVDGFHSILWAAVGRFVMVDSGNLVVILAMVSDLLGNHKGGSDDCYGKQSVLSLIPN
jgi:hypothetical protein